MPQFLALSHLEPAAIGRQRYVFVHPSDPDLIVKVTTEGYIERRRGLIGKWYKNWHRRRLRSRHFLVFLREIREHLALRAAGPELPPHVQSVVGFVETDMGLGLVSRAVRGRDGKLAPTLTALLRDGRFDDHARRKLDEFFAWLIDSPVVIGDLNVGNLVYGYDRAVGDHFVVIDGLGDKNIIPLNSISRSLNRMSKLRRVERINAAIARLQPKAPAATPDRSASPVHFSPRRPAERIN
jgi:hypothetical protein